MQKNKTKQKKNQKKQKLDDRSKQKFTSAAFSKLKAHQTAENDTLSNKIRRQQKQEVRFWTVPRFLHPKVLLEHCGTGLE